MRTILGDNIAYLRTSRKESTTEFGEHFGVSHAAISKWEAGDSVPRKDKRHILENMSGMSFDDLCSKPIPKFEIPDLYGEFKIFSRAVRDSTVAFDTNEIITFLNGLADDLKDETGDFAKGSQFILSFVLSTMKKESPTDAAFRTGIRCLMDVIDDEEYGHWAAGFIVLAILYNAFFLKNDNTTSNIIGLFIGGRNSSVSMDDNMMREIIANKNHPHDIYTKYQSEFQTAMGIVRQIESEELQDILSLLPMSMIFLIRPFPEDQDELQDVLHFIKNYVQIQIALGNKEFYEMPGLLTLLDEFCRKFTNLQL